MTFNYWLVFGAQQTFFQDFYCFSFLLLNLIDWSIAKLFLLVSAKLPKVGWFRITSWTCLCVSGWFWGASLTIWLLAWCPLWQGYSSSSRRLVCSHGGGGVTSSKKLVPNAQSLFILYWFIFHYSKKANGWTRPKTSENTPHFSRQYQKIWGQFFCLFVLCNIP